MILSNYLTNEVSNINLFISKNIRNVKTNDSEKKEKQNVIVESIHSFLRFESKNLKSEIVLTKFQICSVFQLYFISFY